MLAAVLTTLFFAFSAVFGRKTAEIFGSLAGNFWRLVVATFALGILTWIADPASFAAAPFLWFLFSGVVGFGVGDVGLFLAFNRLGSRLTMLINLCLAPVFGAIGEFLWHGTRITGAETLAVLVVLAGVGLALLPGPGQLKPRRAFAGGVALSIVAGFGQGFGAVISRHAERIAQETQTDISGMSAAFQRILGGVTVALLAYLVAKHLAPRKVGDLRPAGFSARALPWLLGAALFGPVIGVSCFQWALKETPSALALSIVATTPIVLIPLAYLIEKDVPNRKSLAGAVIAVTGVIWICLLRGG